MSRGGEQAGPACLDDLDAFRGTFYDCLTLRADALFELTDAVLCVEGPVSTLVGLTLTAEHRRGHGALYDGLDSGRIQVERLRRSVVSLPVPRDGHGRITLAVDVSPWLRPDAATSPDRSFCHVYGRGKGQAQMIPGWPYSFVAALEPGRTSWTTLLDAVRLGPGDDATTVTATQLREVIHRLRQAGQHKPGDADILIVFDAGYDVTRLAFLLADLPVEVLGRLRSDRVFCFPPPPRAPSAAGRPWPRVRAGRQCDPAAAQRDHRHRYQPLRHRPGTRMEPAAPSADSPRSVDLTPGPAAPHRGQRHPAPRRPAAR
ncbi:MAG: transposase [Pseudonocardiales bacterium]|nr:transposase [Pseudonocardiales bacterium]